MLRFVQVPSTFAKEKGVKVSTPHYDRLRFQCLDFTLLPQYDYSCRLCKSATKSLSPSLFRFQNFAQSPAVVWSIVWPEYPENAVERFR